MNDAGLSAHGLTLAEVVGDDYARISALAAYVHANTRADGISYTSSLNRGESITMFDRAADGIVVTDVAGIRLTPEPAAYLAGRFGKVNVER